MVSESSVTVKMCFVYQKCGNIVHLFTAVISQNHSTIVYLPRFPIVGWAGSPILQFFSKSPPPSKPMPAHGAPPPS